jgi:dTDP-4-amino-4,6-dideoxygalactose transaminase
MYVGAKPVFADIDLDTYNINCEEILKKITKKTRAILPVHIFGNPVDVERIKNVINNDSIKIIEDCAQSFGAGINCKRTGSIGEIGCLSFYPTKNLGCYGDGGMVVTNSEESYEIIKKLRNHGSSIKVSS